jgi:CHAT domain-containing protein
VILEKAFGPDHPNVATVLNDLAELHRAQGRYADAEPLYKRSLAIREKALGPDHLDVAASLNNLALIYEAQGRYAEAESLLKQSLAIKEKTFGPEHPYVAIALHNLASIYQAQGRYADAESLYERSLAIAEKLIAEQAIGPDHPAIATLLNSMAMLYAKQGRFADAEPLLKRSLAMREKVFGHDHPAIAVSLNSLAALYRAQGRYADALPIVKRTILHNFANKSIAFAVLYGADSGNLIPPKEVLDASYTVLQRSVSSAAGEAISKLAVRFAAGTNELAQLVRKDQDLTAEAGRLDKSIEAAVSKPPNERSPTMEDQIRKRTDEIKIELAKLQQVLNQQYPDYVAFSKPQPVTIEQTQALLADDEALVAIDLDQKSYVWVVTKDRAEWKALSVSARDVSKEIETLRTELDPNASKPFDRDLAYQLYRQLFEPIEGIITQKKRLSFVLDGALTSLPPHILITSDPSNKDLPSLDWLIRKYAVTVLPSVASLKVLRGQQVVVAAPKPMIGFGDPVYDRTVHPLPETAVELHEVARLLGAKPEDIKLGKDATVTDVKHERLYDYRIVYFATHAQVARAKAEPALVLTPSSEEDNGLLTASEVAMLKLNADFVVLSACNTAAGYKPDAEALSGLARAFFYAGARSLVVSHWEVDDEATVTLMGGLFAALKANPGLSRAEALRWSMLQMIGNPSKPEFAQPAFWAPFVIVGEPKK